MRAFVIYYIHCVQTNLNVTQGKNSSTPIFVFSLCIQYINRLSCLYQNIAQMHFQLHPRQQKGPSHEEPPINIYLYKHVAAGSNLSGRISEVFFTCHNL